MNISQFFFIICTYIISFNRVPVITNMHQIYFIIFRLKIVYIFMRTQFFHFQVFYNIRHLYFIIFTYMFSFIRVIVVTHILLIYLIRFFLKINIYLCELKFCSFMISISSIIFSSSFLLIWYHSSDSLSSIKIFWYI